MKKNLVTLIITFCCATLVNAQGKNKSWTEISALVADGLYKSAIEQIDIKYANALENGNDVEFLKAIIYRLTCQQYLAENVNVSMVNLLRTDLQNAKTDVAKALINSLLGETLWYYYSQNRWQFHNRTDVNDDASNTNIETWSLNRIFAECIAACKRSLEPRETLCNIKANYIDSIVIANTSTRQYRPTLYDFVAHRAIETLGNSEIRVTTPKEIFTLNNEKYFTCNAGEFANMQIESTDSTSALLCVLQSLQQLTKFHLQQNDVLALDDITLKRLDFLHVGSTLENKNELFIKSLEKFTQTGRKNDVWFQAMHKLAFEYRYANENVKAVETCKLALQQANINSRQKSVFENYESELKRSWIQLTVETVAIPAKPVKILVGYKDVDTVYFRLYKVRDEHRLTVLQKDINQNGIEFIKKYTTMADEWKQALPQTGDYKEHSTEIAYARRTLPQGNFVITASNSKNFNNGIVEYASFQLSSISFIYRNTELVASELYIVNRETGEPLQNATLKLFYGENPTSYKEYTSNNDGVIKDIVSRDYGNIITIQKDNDIFIKSNNSIYQRNWDPFSFENENETKIFTDRAIYRPGQTVYFKGIALNFNDNKYVIAPNRKEKITLNDANGQEVSKIETVSNEYGTFSGSFVLPQSALGGEFSLEGDYGSCYFSVEEYKRPAFEVTVNNVEKNYNFGDTVTISGIAKAYAGYNIDNANVSYSIGRTLEFPYRWWWAPVSINLKTIANGETKTDENGKFEINFNADGSGLKNDMQIAAYTISVDVTDNSGETHSTQYTLRIGKKPLVITANIPEIANLADSLSFDLTAKNLNDNYTEADIEVKIYKLKQPEKPLRKRLWQNPDKPILSYAEYKNLFPDDVYTDEDEIEKYEETNLVKTISFNTDKTKKINLDELKKYGVAAYKLDITAKNKQNVETGTIVYLQLQNENTLIDMNSWVQKRTQTDKHVDFYVGGTGDKFHVRYDVVYRNKTVESRNIAVGSVPQQVRINIPQTKNDEEFEVSFTAINNNRHYTSYHTLKPQSSNNNLDISFVTFRDKLQPGEKEQWKLQVKSPNGDKAIAEMVASLYDASLDVFRPHTWSKNFADSRTLSYYYNNWANAGDFSCSAFSNSRHYISKNLELNKGYDRLLDHNHIWQHGLSVTKPFAASNQTAGVTGLVTDQFYQPLQYVAVWIKDKPNMGTYTNKHGEFVINGAENGDVLVFSYSGNFDQKKTVEKNTAISVIFEIGVVEEVIPFAGSYRVRGAVSESAIYGSRAANEVVLITTKHGSSDNAFENIQARSNFNETAFFYPELRTNEQGEIIMDFTIPEALTRWKLLAMAHTKNLETGFVTAYAVTQKEIAISANAPRFFRDGDEIEFSAKVNNITDSSVNGNARLLLFDAFTMQPVNIIENETEQPFFAKAGQSVALKWKLKIPSNINAITYRLLASTETHSDGEEKTIPVLPNTMLVIESLPFTVRAKESKDFEFEKLLNGNNNSSTLKNYSYTLELVSNPVWYAVQALPYIMEYPYECSEQIFSRFYANSLSTKIIDNFPQIKRTFDLWKMKDSKELLSNLEKNQELKNILIEETPWLRSAKDESENKKRIALLFDLNKMNSEQQSALNKLKNNQKDNGAFPWFNGMCESRYITQYIVTGLEHLEKLNAVSNVCKSDVEKIKSTAINYLDKEMEKDYRIASDKNQKSKYDFVLTLNYLYMRSFSGTVGMTEGQKTAFNHFLNEIDREWQKKSIYQQALIAITLHRFGKKETALQIINSLKERAQKSAETGMYWKENVRGYFWHQAPIETQSLLIEAFSETGNNTKEIEEMKIWLLLNKQTTNWKTTTATAKACYALLMNGSNSLQDSQRLQVKLGSKSLSKLKKDELQNDESGTGYIKTSWHNNEVENDFGKISVTNPNSTVAWGAAYWQYFENLEKITSAETDLKIKREYFIETDTDDGKKLVRIDEQHKLRVGDKVIVRIEINANRDYEYVHLKDMRASGFEPVNTVSSSKYQDGIWYYENTKDASTNFFIYMLPKGTRVFEYSLRAGNTGAFSTGITTLQCMYAPEFSAHSAGEKIIINEMKN